MAPPRKKGKLSKNASATKNSPKFQPPARTNRWSRNPPNYYTQHHDNEDVPPHRYYTKHYQNRYRLQRKPTPSPARPVRPISPPNGTEEYTARKIQETSDMIKKQLLMSKDESVQDVSKEYEKEAESNVNKSSENVNDCDMNVDKANSPEKSNKSISKTNKKIHTHNVEDIHNSIINHIAKLNRRQKQNLINSDSTSYDVAIEQVYLRKRLELSKALRAMCMQDSPKSSEVVNSIIPDFGIKIEDLPKEVIEALSTTLNMNCNNESLSFITPEVHRRQSVDSLVPHPIKTEVEMPENLRNDDVIMLEEPAPNVTIKSEPIDLESSNNPPNVEEPDVQIIDTIKPEPHEESFQLSLAGAICGSTSYIKELDCEDNSNLTPSASRAERVQSNKQTIDRISQTGPLQQVCDMCKTTNLEMSELFRKKPTTLADGIVNLMCIDKQIRNLMDLKEQYYKYLDLNRETADDEECNIIPNLPNENFLTPESTNWDSEIDRDSGGRLKRKNFKFSDIKEKVTSIKLVKETVLVSSQSGNFFIFNKSNMAFIRSMNVASASITAFVSYDFGTSTCVAVGCHPSYIKFFDFLTFAVVPARTVVLRETFQCMDSEWGYIFIGSREGTLFRYKISSGQIEDESYISSASIMVIKATQEATRRVLLVGQKSTPICVRDAISTLVLRSMEEIKCSTIYSLVLYKSLVYCATPQNNILVYSFHDGTCKISLKECNEKGVGTLKVYKNKLFASCYDGYIYIFNIDTNLFLCRIQGPGGVIISMEILPDQILTSTLSSKCSSIKLPDSLKD